MAVPTIDTATQGNWIGVYGSSGYILPAYNSAALVAGDEVSLPSFITSYSYTDASAYIWNGGTAETRVPQDPLNPVGLRTAGTAYRGGGPFTVNLLLNQATHFELGVYGLDYDSDARSASVTVNGETVNFQNLDAAVNGLLDHYRNGVWGVWDLDLPAGPVSITVNHLGGANAVISAITFDEIQEVPEPASVGLWLLLGTVALGTAIGYRRSQHI